MINLKSNHSEITLLQIYKGATSFVVSNIFFQRVFKTLINFISTYVNLLQHFNFVTFLLVEDYGKCALRNEPVIGHGLKQPFFESLTDKSY